MCYKIINLLNNQYFKTNALKKKLKTIRSSKIHPRLWFTRPAQITTPPGNSHARSRREEPTAAERPESWMGARDAAIEESSSHAVAGATRRREILTPSPSSGRRGAARFRKRGGFKRGHRGRPVCLTLLIRSRRKLATDASRRRDRKSRRRSGFPEGVSARGANAVGLLAIQVRTPMVFFFFNSLWRNQEDAALVLFFYCGVLTKTIFEFFKIFKHLMFGAVMFIYATATRKV